MRNIELLTPDKSLQNKIRLDRDKLLAYTGIKTDILAVTADTVRVRVEQVELKNNYLLNQSQLVARAGKLFEPLNRKYKLHFVALTYKPNLEALQAGWLVQNMQEFKLSAKDLEKQVGISSETLTEIKKGKVQLTPLQKTALYYYFITFALNRDLRAAGQEEEEPEYTGNTAESKEPQTIFDIYEYQDLTGKDWNGMYNDHFAISFPKVKAGWLTVEIKAGGKTISYDASYCLGQDCIPSLLEALIDLLDTIGEQEKYFGTLLSHTHAIHNSEPTEYVWDFGQGNPMRILLREDPDLEYEKDRFLNGYEDAELEYMHEDVTPEKLQESLLLAISIKKELFVVKLYLACRRLITSVGDKKYKEEWYSDFPHDLLTLLEQWIMLSVPHSWGLWHYTNNDYSTRLTGTDRKTLKVEGRRMATDAELKQKGIW